MSKWGANIDGLWNRREVSFASLSQASKLTALFDAKAASEPEPSTIETKLTEYNEQYGGIDQNSITRLRAYFKRLAANMSKMNNGVEVNGKPFTTEVKPPTLPPCFDVKEPKRFTALGSYRGKEIKAEFEISI